MWERENNRNKKTNKQKKGRETQKGKNEDQHFVSPGFFFSLFLLNNKRPSTHCESEFE